MMTFRVTPEPSTEPLMYSVEISQDGSTWQFVCMTDREAVAETIVNSFKIVLETHAEEALQDIMETLED